MQQLLPALLLLGRRAHVRRNNQSTRVALGGISAALSLTLLLLSSLIPFATYAVPAMAGIALLPIGIEIGLSVGALSYGAVALLGLLILPDREVSMLFITFFGYYPLLKLRIDRTLRHRFPRVLLKFGIFNVTMIGCYWAVIRLLGMGQIAEELENGFGALLLLIGNLSFPVYELALRNIMLVYHSRVRKLLFKD